MDVQRVRRFKPSFKDFPRDLSSTELTISDIRIVLSPDRQTASVTLTAQYRNTYRKGAMPGAESPQRLEAHVAGPTKRRRLDPPRIVERERDDPGDLARFEPFVVRLPVAGVR